MAILSRPVNEKVWELQHNGKTERGIKKNKKANYYGRLDQPGSYVLLVDTHGTGKAKANFTLCEDDKSPQLIKRVAAKDRVCARFTIESPASWILVLSSSSILKEVKVSACLFLGLEDSQLPFDQHAEEIELLRVDDSTQTKKEQDHHEDEEWSLEKLRPAQQQKVLAVTNQWPPRIGTNRLNYPQHKAIEELARDSRYKVKAFDAGLIRPFLFLVSMHPEDRLRWAHSLGIDLADMAYFGDAHRESWHILTEDHLGIQARANHAYSESLNPLSQNASWYQIVQRVCRKSIAQSEAIECMAVSANTSSSPSSSSRIDSSEEDTVSLSSTTSNTCSSSSSDSDNQSVSKKVHLAHRSKSESQQISREKDSEEMLALENLFAYSLADFIDYQLEQEQPQVWEELHNFLNNNTNNSCNKKKLCTIEMHLDLLVDKLEAAGYTDRDHMRLLAAQALLAADRNEINSPGNLYPLQHSMEKHDEKRAGKANFVIAMSMLHVGFLATCLVLWPTAILTAPCLMMNTACLALYAAGRYCVETPAKLLLPLLAIMQQKETLAYHDIHIEDYYPLRR